MNTKKVQKKRGKKRGTRLCAFFLRILFRCRHRHREETIIVVVTFFTSLAESPDDFDDENFGNAQERERDPVVATSKRKREKGGLLLLENFNGAHRKKKRFDDRLFVSNFTKALFCRVKCALKKKGRRQKVAFYCASDCTHRFGRKRKSSRAFFCRDVK